jgi:hypothetical protein
MQQPDRKLKIAPAAPPTRPLLNRDLSPGERARLRRRLEAASTRPGAGTSSALARPLSSEALPYGGQDVTTHDLVGMAPFALLRRG